MKKDLAEHIMIPAESIEVQDETHKIAGTFYTDISQWKSVKKGSRLNNINKASIACEIEFEGKRFLFCGDSEMNDIRDSLQSHYDVIKLSHHGTYYGNRCFIGEKAVTADKYIISTNAIREKREHPNRNLLQGIIMLSHKKEFYCNYDILHIKNGIYKMLKSKDQQEKYNFSYQSNFKKIVL